VVSIHRSQGDPAYVSLTFLENRQNLGRTYRPVRMIQCSRRAVLPVDRLLAYVFIAWSRTRRSKRKLAAKPQATAFLRVQTSDSIKVSIEIKLPSGISILVPIYLHSEPIDIASKTSLHRLDGHQVARRSIT
jgi:hypothetical protein